MARKIKKFFLFFFGIIFLLMLAGSVYIAYTIADQVSHLSSQAETNKNTSIYLAEHHFDLDSFVKEYQLEEQLMKSSFQDHSISFVDLHKEPNYKGTVILVHGLGSTKESVYPHSKIFLDNGYRTIIYDQRNSGKNTAKTNSFGVYESKDLLDIIDYAKNNHPGNKLVVWGESFGGATAALAASKLDSETINYLILDSPMDDAQTIAAMNMKDIAKEMNIPLSFLIFLGDLGLRIYQGYSFVDAFPSKQLKGNTIPLLVIHSHSDTVIPYEMGKSIFKASSANKKILHSVKSGEHTNLFFESPEAYTKLVLKFIEE